MRKLHPIIKQAKVRTLAVTDERAYYWILLGILVFSFVLYVVYVNQTVRNVVRRQQLDREISSLNARIGELEFKYISMKNDVTIDKAYAMGFRDVAETKFESRKTVGEVALGTRMQ